MTVPPNYGPPPEQPQTPGYGYQSPYGGGQNPYGSQPQQPPYGGPAGAGGGQQPPYGGGGGQPPYGQDPGPYGGPVLPPEPPKRNLGLIGGIVVGATVLVLGAVLLVTMNIKGNDDDKSAEGGEDTSESASENDNTPEEDATTPAEESGSEVGQCLAYEYDVQGSGFPLVDCSDATAFWEITAQSYDVTDIAVDDEGYVLDTAPVYELCGEGWGANQLGKAWTHWDYVYSSGSLDSLYCLEAVGNPDPAEPEHLPIMPDVGDCFDDSDRWWSIDCGSSLAMYTVVDTIMLPEPVKDMTEEAAEAEGTNCGTDWYWEMTDGEGRTYGILCGDDV